jgi:exopolysaccharide production protein ExoZ
MRATAPARPATVVTIQYLRAIAASVVVLYHAMSAPSIAALFPVRIGEFGVDLFFVISGYIMWTTTAGSGRGPLAFWGARILRVAPLYWIFTTLYLAIALLRPDAVFNAALEPLHIVKSYLFMPAAHPSLGAIAPVYTLGWTLNYEMFFYLVFGLCLTIPRWTPRLAAMIGALSLLVLIGTAVRPSGAVAATYTNPILLEFAAGIVLACLASRLDTARPGIGWALIAVAIAWLVTAHMIQPLPERIVAFGIPAALMVAGALILEPSARLRPSRFALLLGDASYSIYLAHPFAQRIWYFVFGAVIGADTPATVGLYVVTAIIAGIGGGVVSYVLIERPIIAAGRRRRASGPSSPAPAIDR